MTTKELKQVRETVAAALRTAEAQLGYSLQIGTVRWDSRNGLRFTVRGQGTMTAPVATSSTNPHIGNIVMVAGAQYEIVDYIPRRHKYPYVGKRVKDGLRFKLSRWPVEG